MGSFILKPIALFGLGLAVCLPSAAFAQQMAYGDVSGVDSDDMSSGDVQGDDGDGASPKVSLRGKKAYVKPYIEASQVASFELSPGNEVLTWSTIAAGVDAGINGTNTRAAVSLRYERRFGWGNNTSDGDVVSGLARVSTAIVPRVLNLEAGALAARTSIENNGSTVTGKDFGDSVTQIYSIYAGPTLQTHMGDVGVEANYRIGYTRVEAPDALVVSPGQASIDVFDDSVVHSAAVHLGTKPGEPLPVGLGVGAGWDREDISNLDQRVDSKQVRGDVSLPIGNDLTLVGGVGYEDVSVSSRDAMIDSGTGLPVVGSDGRFVTDKSQPRRIAYESEGLIWDAGVIWKPSRRTALEAHVGKRYGSTSYFGSFAYAPNRTTSINISAYDSISGFGGALNKALAGLPTQFQTVRNPLTGGFSGCVVPTAAVGADQGACLGGALASVRSAVFRGRGVMASLGINAGRLQYGIGAGYDRRKFIAAPGTVLAVANGVVDENLWVAAYLNGRIDRNSSFSTTAYANWYQSGDALAGDVNAIGATAAYYRTITSHLSATAAVGIDGVSRDLLDDIWTARGMVGVRYSF